MRLFKKWLRATDTETLSDVVNLLVLEQFKSKLPFFLLRHTEDQGETDVVKVASKVDVHYLLVQSLQSEGGSHKSVKSSSDAPKFNKQTTPYLNQGGYSPFCSYCKQPGHRIQQCKKSPACKVSK